VEVSPHKKRRGVVKSERNGKNDACSLILKGFEATEKDVGSEDAQVVADYRESREGIAEEYASHPMNSDVGSEDAQGAEHRESHEGIAAAASNPTNSDEPPSSASGRQRRVST
jgi:hypothetical protein